MPARGRHGSDRPRAWRDADWWPSRNGLLKVSGCAVVIATGCFYFGADGWWSVTIGLLAAVVVTVIGYAVRAPSDFREPAWTGGRARTRAGARTDIDRVATELRGRYGRVGPAALRRLQGLAQRALLRLDLDLGVATDRPAIEGLVGPGAYRWLTATDVRRGPSRRTYGRLLDLISSLDAPSRPEGAAPSIRPTRRSLRAR